MKQDIWSPCIKVCFVDPPSRQCVGCFRTLEELGRWTKMTDAEREAVRPMLEVRKAEYLAKRGTKAPAAKPAAPSPCTTGEAKACDGPAACGAMGLDCPALR